MEYNPLLNQLKLPDMDGYSNGFDINQIRNIDTRLRRIEMKMQQIRAECNCKKMDYNYFDSNNSYDD